MRILLEKKHHQVEEHTTSYVGTKLKDLIVENINTNLELNINCHTS